MHGNFNPPNMKKCYPYFDRLGKIFSNTYNINYLTDQLPRLKMIELKTEKSAEELPPQVLQEYSEFLIDLYFYIKDFNPDLKPDSKEISTSQSNPRLKSQSYSSDLSDENVYEPIRRFLLSFALFIGLCGLMILSQISYLPVTSQVFLSPGIMFLIVSAVSVYISRKI